MGTTLLPPECFSCCLALFSFSAWCGILVFLASSLPLVAVVVPFPSASGDVWCSGSEVTSCGLLFVVPGIHELFVECGTKSGGHAQVELMHLELAIDEQSRTVSQGTPSPETSAEVMLLLTSQSSIKQKKLLP